MRLLFLNTGFLALPAALVLTACQVLWPVSSYDEVTPLQDASAAKDVSPQEPVHCSDGVQNQHESDIDCGGGQCQPCGPLKSCASNSDCRGGKCDSNNKCLLTCSDRVQNQGESDVDCGGVHCPQCVVGRTCLHTSDCAASECVSGHCAQTCSDKAKNQDETDVDCGGGKCKQCGSGLACKVASDCEPGSCLKGYCRKCGQTTGGKPPGLVVSSGGDASLGCNFKCWQPFPNADGPPNLTAALNIDDGWYALCDVPASANSRLLVATAFGLASSVPASAEITGIRLHLLRATSGTPTTNHDLTIKLFREGQAVGLERADTGTQWPQLGSGGPGVGWRLIGGEGDLWGESWSAADIRDSEFGFGIATHNYYSGGCSSAYLDLALLEVFFCS